MGIIHQSIPMSLASDLQRRYKLTVFVESGLGQGTSALWAEKHFATCVSIEKDAGLVNKFRESYPNSAVKIIEGDSGFEMALLVPNIAARALFWLDGHTDDYTPVLAEIEAINASKQNHVIMVDDLRLFDVLPAWPSVSKLRIAARNGTRRFVQEIDDVLIARPYVIS